MRPFGIREKLRRAVSAGSVLGRGMQAVQRFRRKNARRLAIAGTAGGIAGILTLIFLLSRRAEVRLVNTYEEPLVLFLDGKTRTTLPTVAAETPDSGVRIRLEPGTHKLRTETATGVVIDDTEIHLAASGSYLFSPGETDQCFFVEHTAYGEALPLRPAIASLPRGERLWRLPDEVDAWFVPNPPASSEDKRSSGGTRTAVRQARCGFSPWK